MKTKLRHISRRTIAMILCILMMFSTLIVGSISTVNALSGQIYFDNSITKWDQVYCFLGHNGYLKSYEMQLDSDDIWKTKASFNNEWNDATGVFFASVDGGVSSGSTNKKISDRPDDTTEYTATNTSVKAGTGNCYVALSISKNSGTSIMTVDKAKATHSSNTGTKVINTDLISVLKGEKVMFYYGDVWGGGTKFLRTTSATSTTVDSGSSSQRTVYYNDGTTDTKYHSRVACVEPKKYYISNGNSWGGTQMQEIAVAGKAYIHSSSGYGSNSVITGMDRSGATMSASSYSIKKGTVDSGVSATLTYAKSVTNQDNKLEYYYTSDNTNFYRFNPADASSLAEGNYTIYAVTYDGYIRVKSAQATLTVINKVNSDITYVNGEGTTGSEYTLSEGYPTSAGTGDNVTFTVTPKPGYSIAVSADNNVTVSGPTNNVYSFTMPSSAVTITITANPIEYTNTINCTNATISNLESLKKVKYNQTVEFTPVAKEGYTITSVKMNDTELTPIDGVYSFTQPSSAVTITVTTTANKYTNTFTCTNAKIDSKTSGEIEGTYGQPVEFTPEADTGYTITSVEMNGTKLTPTGNVYSFTQPASAVSITVTATANKYKNTFSCTNAKIDSKTSGEIEGTYGQPVTFKPVADTGHTITSVKMNDTELTPNSDGVYSFNQPASVVTITVIAKANTHTITYRNDGNGTISGKESESYGQSVALTITPKDDSYELDKISVYNGDTLMEKDAPTPAGIFIVPDYDATLVASFKGVTPRFTAPADFNVTTGAKFTVDVTGPNYGTLSYKLDNGEFQTSNEFTINDTGSHTITIKADNHGTVTTQEVNVTASYCKEYTDLQASYNEFGKEEQTNYESTDAGFTAAWTAYTDAKTNAETLLATYDYSKKDEYTTAKTNLETAYDKLQPFSQRTTIYVLSKANSNLKIWSWNRDKFKITESGETGTITYPKENGTEVGAGYLLKNLGTIDLNSGSLYLYKITYTGTTEFKIYSGTGAINNNGTEYTGEINFSEVGTHYFDLSNSDGGSTTEYAKEFNPFSITASNSTGETGSEVSLSSMITVSGDLISKKNTKQTKVYSSFVITNSNNDTVATVTNNTWTPTTAGVYTVNITSHVGTQATALYEDTATATITVTAKTTEPVKYYIDMHSTDAAPTLNFTPLDGYNMPTTSYQLAQVGNSTVYSAEIPTPYSYVTAGVPEKIGWEISTIKVNDKTLKIKSGTLNKKCIKTGEETGEVWIEATQSLDSINAVATTPQIVKKRRVYWENKSAILSSPKAYYWKSDGSVKYSECKNLTDTPAMTQLSANSSKYYIDIPASADRILFVKTGYVDNNTNKQKTQDLTINDNQYAFSPGNDFNTDGYGNYCAYKWSSMPNPKTYTSDITFYLGDAAASIKPDLFGGATVNSYSVADKSIATVSNAGLAKPLKCGTTTVTYTITNDNSDSAKTFKTNIKVIERPVAFEIMSYQSNTSTFSGENATVRVATSLTGSKTSTEAIANAGIVSGNTVTYAVADPDVSDYADLKLTVTATATPTSAEGFEFKGWTLNGNKISAATNEVYTVALTDSNAGAYVAVYAKKDTTKTVAVTYYFKDYDTSDGVYYYDSTKPLIDSQYTKDIFVEANDIKVESIVKSKVIADMPQIVSNYFDYELQPDTTFECTKDGDGNITSAAVSFKEKVHMYDYQVSGGPENKTVTGSGTYQAAITVNKSDFGITGGVVWKLGNTALSTNASYTFRIISDKMNITVEADENAKVPAQSVIDFSYSELSYEETADGTTKQKLTQNFYIADYFNAENIIAEHSNYKNVQFEGAGMLYHNTATTVTNDKVAYIKNRIGDNYSTSIATSTRDKIAFNYHALAEDLNGNVLRYSNSLNAYQYILAIKLTNNSKNDGKTMTVYSYYVYSYFEDSVKKYQVVLSDTPVQAAVYKASANPTGN